MGKRPNGQGSVYRRKDGWWVAALPYTDPTGRRKKRTRLCRTEAEADLALARMKIERDGGVLVSGENPAFRDWLVAWLRDAVYPRVSPVTLEWYEIALRVHIIPRIGDVRIRDLTPRHVSSVDAHLQRQGYAVETRQKIVGILKRALRQAEAWGDIPKSPGTFVPAPKDPHVAEEDDEIQAFSESELVDLFSSRDRFRTLYVVAGRTGLRQGELLALRASDLDLASSPATLAVRRSVSRKPGGGYYYTPLKNRRQRRRVALHFEAAEALQEQLEVRGDSSDDLLWPSGAGTPMNARNMVCRYYEPALERAGLPPLNFHALRHTFASIALYDWRMPVALVSELLGHANTSITLDIYAHLAPGTHEMEMKRINDLYAAKTLSRPRSATE